MKTYAEFRPTGFDYRGLGLPERQDWLVLGVTRTRDSGALDESNFEAALQILGGESETVEVHRFGHWGPGWFEIILIDPARESEGDAIEARLEDYPVLDDDDHSRRELEEYDEAWENWGRSDFLRGLARRMNLSDAAEELLDDSGDRLREYYESLIPSGEYYIPESSGVALQTDRAVKEASRDDVAGFLRVERRGVAVA